MRRRSEAGFTIVEVLVAMGLLLLGMTSIMGLFAFGTALARTGELRSVGAAAIEAVVADLEAGLFPLEGEGPFAAAGAPPEEVRGSLPGGVRYRARTTPDPDDDRPGGPLRWRVDVEVSWQAGGERRHRKFTTLLLREVPFGERLRRELVEPPAVE